MYCWSEQMRCSSHVHLCRPMHTHVVKSLEFVYLCPSGYLANYNHLANVGSRTFLPSLVLFFDRASHKCAFIVVYPVESEKGHVRNYPTNFQKCRNEFSIMQRTRIFSDIKRKILPIFLQIWRKWVEVTGFEPTAFWSRRIRRYGEIIRNPPPVSRYTLMPASHFG